MSIPASNVDPDRPSRSMRRFDHREPANARRVFDLLELAHAQESALIGSSALQQRSVHDICTSVGIHFGVFDSCRLVALVIVGPDDEPQQLALALVAVHPDFQRQGLARGLISAVLSEAGAMPFAVTVACSNGPALALYAALGFVEQRRGTLGKAQLPMIKLCRSAA